MKFINNIRKLLEPPVLATSDGRNWKIPSRPTLGTSR